MHAHQLARRGLLHVREGRHVFANMTLEENLAAATFALTGRARRTGGFDDIYGYFPLLAEPAQILCGAALRRRAADAGDRPRAGRRAAAAAGRRGFARPRADDRPGDFRYSRPHQREKKLAILVVEQNVSLALKHAAYGYVLENGAVVLQGTAAELADRELVSSRYLGGHAAAPAL